MTLTDELASSASVDREDAWAGYEVDITMEQLAFEPPEDVQASGGRGRRAGRRASAELGALVSTAALVGGACTASVIVASVLRGKRPLSGVEAIARGLGIARPRTKGRSGIPVGVVGGVVIAGGALVLAGLQRGLVGMSRRRGSLAARAASLLVVPVVAYGLDRTVMAEGLLPELRRVLGRRGLFAKYASMGLASALAAR